MSTEPREENSAATKRAVSLFSETLLVAWVPIAFYFLAFCFQKEYCAKFGIPLCLVQVGGAELVGFAAALINIWYFLILLVGAGFYDFVDASEKVISGYLFLITLGFTFFTLSLPFTMQSLLSFSAVGIAIIFDIFAYLFRGDSEFKVRGVFRILQAATPAAARENPFVRRLVELVWITLVGIGISRSLGQYTARNAEWFPVSNANDNRILIASGSGGVICSSYDPASRKIQGSFVILPIAEKDESAFTNRKIGPLNFPNPDPY